jgi:hypothetical protein
MAYQTKIMDTKNKPSRQAVESGVAIHWMAQQRSKEVYRMPGVRQIILKAAKKAPPALRCRPG